MRFGLVSSIGAPPVPRLFMIGLLGAALVLPLVAPSPDARAGYSPGGAWSSSPGGGALEPVLLEDDFDAENGGVTSPETFAFVGWTNWDVLEGSVDLVGNGFHDYDQTGYGTCGDAALRGNG